MPGLARVGDFCVGICNLVVPVPATGIIMTSSLDVTTNGLGQARLTDTVIAPCAAGTITTSSSTVTANLLGVARMGDVVSGVFTGVIIGGSIDSMSG